MRLIDADALRESIITRQPEISYEDAWALTCVDNAPTIEPQPKWIPCSDRTPNYPNGAETYWCSACECDVHAEEYIVMIKGAELPTALFWDGCHWFDIDGNETLYPVVAWMPFPEPYKGDVTDSQDESTPVYLSELYLCDPDKNTECKKTACYRNGGECIHTVHKEYRRVE